VAVESESLVPNLDITSVVVVGRDPLARSALVGILANAAGIVLAGETQPLASALIARNAADAVLCDLAPDPDTVVCWMRRVAPAAPPVLALVDDTRQALDALAAGAQGAIPRRLDLGVLAAALRAVARRLLVVERSVAGDLVSATDLAHEPLTEREIEALELICEGLSNKAIAARLRVSEHTAKFHVASICAKLRVSNRTRAAVLASRLHLVGPQKARRRPSRVARPA
jgi:two-component system, NarL family, nitrate/nitrite response regulator NarL